MREENARRKLNKKLDALARDSEGGTGMAKASIKLRADWEKRWLILRWKIWLKMRPTLWSLVLCAGGSV